jgi:hypothetical protein
VIDRPIDPPLCVAVVHLPATSHRAPHIQEYLGQILGDGVLAFQARLDLLYQFKQLLEQEIVTQKTA